MQDANSLIPLEEHDYLQCSCVHIYVKFVMFLTGIDDSPFALSRDKEYAVSVSPKKSWTDLFRKLSSRNLKFHGNTWNASNYVAGVCWNFQSRNSRSCEFHSRTQLWIYFLNRSFGRKELDMRSSLMIVIQCKLLVNVVSVECIVAGISLLMTINSMWMMCICKMNILKNIPKKYNYPKK